MVEIAKPQRFFQLEGVARGQKDKGHMGFDDLRDVGQRSKEGRLLRDRRKH